MIPSKAYCSPTGAPFSGKAKRNVSAAPPTCESKLAVHVNATNGRPLSRPVLGSWLSLGGVIEMMDS